MSTLTAVMGLSFGQALIAPVTMKRAAKVGLIVGTILILINQGDLLLAGIVPPVWKLLLTYCVPYSVSSYSTAAFIADLSRTNAPNAR